MPLHIVILGAGITGLTSALALRKHLPSPKPEIKVIEIRATPSTIGGAVNLTPKALRYLDHLGVSLSSSDIGAECKTIEIFDLYSAAKISELDFTGPDGDGIGKEKSKRHFARRVMRWQLHKALLEQVQAQDETTVLFGKKVTHISEPEEGGVRLSCDNGETLIGDVLVGADGIHSATRALLVDSDRTPTYTGISVTMATANVRAGSQLRWQTTGLANSRRGSLMCSYFDEKRQQQYVSAVMEVAEVDSREGWRIRGADQKAIKEDILNRFKCDKMSELTELIEDAGEWTLYPVYSLPSGGKWTSPGGRCILLGDAAHAMPPQGESTGICIEDAIIFSRAMMQHEYKSLSAIFTAYEAFRRQRIDDAHKAASMRWETVKDSGWLSHQLKMLLTPVFIWWTSKARLEEFAEDHTDLEFQIEG